MSIYDGIYVWASDPPPAIDTGEAGGSLTPTFNQIFTDVDLAEMQTAAELIGEAAGGEA